MIYTTVKDYEIFKKECWKWINLLGLHEWEYQFYHKSIVSLSEITSHYKAKIIVINFTKAIKQTHPLKIKTIKDSAQHEIFHVLLENLFHYGMSRTIDSNVYQSEEHKVIHQLQKAFEI